MTAKKITATDLNPAPIRRGRGRPSTGNALTATERKVLQRERDRNRPVAEQSLEALLAAAGQAIQGGDMDALKLLVIEMQRRAKLADAAAYTYASRQ